jgi:hypothetical protein
LVIKEEEKSRCSVDQWMTGLQLLLQGSQQPIGDCSQQAGSSRMQRVSP